MSFTHDIWVTRFQHGSIFLKNPYARIHSQINTLKRTNPHRIQPVYKPCIIDKGSLSFLICQALSAQFDGRRGTVFSRQVLLPVGSCFSFPLYASCESARIPCDACVSRGIQETLKLHVDPVTVTRDMFKPRPTESHLGAPEICS